MLTIHRVNLNNNCTYVRYTLSMEKLIYMVTGNPGKLRELEAIVPDNLHIQMRPLELDEIQSMDLNKIVRDKLQRAYDQLNAPVMVDDVSAGLDSLGGLPGPFFKFFEEEMGPATLLKLSGKPGAKATITCTAGYYDGSEFIICQGTTKATIVEPRGKNGFGFDQVVLVDGQQKTNAEMTADEKNQISHRRKAFDKLFAEIERRLKN